MDLDRLSPALEEALVQARELARQRGEALIQPAHLMHACIVSDPAVGALLTRAGVAVNVVADALLEQLGVAPKGKAEPAIQPRASKALRDLLERCLARADARSAETAEPTDFVIAFIESSDDKARSALSRLGLTADALLRLEGSRTVTREALGEGKSVARTPAVANVLERFGRDLTAEAASGSIHSAVGRDDEIRRVIQTLLRKTKNNPVLVGDPGTGKTAIAEGLAWRIATGDVPDSLKGCRLFVLELSTIVAGSKYRGEFEERIKALVDQVRAAKGNVIVFLDELHTLVGAGGSEGGMDAANILKPALARGEFRCIGATTFDEYRERIEKDGALARRFELITVREPNDETMMLILRGIRPRYEAYHGVRLSEEAMQAAVKLTRRYIRNRFFPDKAIDVIDEATARIRMQRESKPVAIDELERLLVRKKAELEALQTGSDGRQKNALSALRAEISELEPRVAALIERWKSQKDTADNLQKTKQAIEEQSRKLADAESRRDITAAAEIRYGSLKYLEQQRQDLEKQVEQLTASGEVVPEEVRAEHVAEIVGERTGIPIQRMLENERERLIKLEERLSQRVLGQAEAVSAVAEAVRRSRTDLELRRKPNSFLFVGPTGVGKTELAKALAEALFDDEGALIRVDMAEYKEHGSVSGLIGARPGLVGSDEGGFLTEKVRRSPYSVVLFDEIEKAHPEVLDLLLGVLDEGRLSDAKQRFCDFSNAMILFTSNLGVREAAAAAEDADKIKEIILSVVQASLRPEFFNRISQVVVFNPLTTGETRRIVEQRLDKLRTRLADDRDIALSVTAEALEYLAHLSYDPIYGARPVDRVIQQEVLSPIATALLVEDIKSGNRLEIARSGDDSLAFNVPDAAPGGDKGTPRS